MKKILSLSLAGLLCLGLLAGCGGSPAPAEGEGVDASASESKGTKLVILDTEYIQEEYAIAVAKDNDELLGKINTALKELEEDGTKKAIVDKYISGVAHELVFQEKVTDDMPLLVMGTNAAFPPYEFYEGDKIVGIDAEMAAAIADKLGMRLQIDHMEFDSIIAAIQTGKADMGMAGMTVTEERLKNINFSDSYAIGIQSIIVPEGSPITTADDLSADGAKYLIGTQKGTTGDIYSEGDFGADRVMKYANGADAVQALRTNKVDCVIIDNEPAKALVASANK